MRGRHSLGHGFDLQDFQYSVTNSNKINQCLFFKWVFTAPAVAPVQGPLVIGQGHQRARPGCGTTVWEAGVGGGATEIEEALRGIESDPELCFFVT